MDLDFNADNWTYNVAQLESTKLVQEEKIKQEEVVKPKKRKVFDFIKKISK